MYNIKTLNSISAKGTERLSNNLFAIDNEAEPDGILLRSADMHDMPLPQSLLAIARAGAGTNNIPTDKCSEQGIVVFNTPGANANAVKELVLGALVLISRNVAPAIKWAATLKGKDADVPKLVEKGKNQFVGPELSGKRLGVIGLGAIGVKVANSAAHLGMEVLGYDPYISIEAAWSLSRSVKHCINVADIISSCDYITLHIPATPETKGFINKQSIAQMKHGVRILNFARGELVDTDAILEGVKSGRVGGYITDFPNDALLCQDGIVCVPHLGASTPESEDNCARMAADEMREYLLNGNIANSVNFPAVSLPFAGGRRICVAHKNVPGILSGITGVTTEARLNIENMVNKSKKDYAYTMLDTLGNVPDDISAKLMALDGVIRVRVI
ncbi:MAG: phosphoglycerate dehydrogenase [Oscillospiraceae bacterium]